MKDKLKTNNEEIEELLTHQNVLLSNIKRELEKTNEIIEHQRGLLNDIKESIEKIPFGLVMTVIGGCYWSVYHGKNLEFPILK